MSILKTAVRAGVASSVHGRVQRRQQNRWATQDQQAAMQAQAAVAHQAPQQPAPVAPAPVAPAQSDTNEQLNQLKQLGELRDAGVLADTEFEAKKAKILDV